MKSISFINKNHDISVEMPEWTRHQPKLALLAMQKIGDQVVYHNSNSEAVIAALKSESDVMIRSEELHRQDEFVKVKSYYIPVYNNNVFNPVKHIRNYNPSKENTHFEYQLKLKFMIGHYKAFVNYEYITDSENHASVADIIEQRTISEILVEVLEKGAIRDDAGIETDQLDDEGNIISENINNSDILIKATDPDGMEVELDMHFEEFLNHLIGIDLVSVIEKEITDLRGLSDRETVDNIMADSMKVKSSLIQEDEDYNNTNQAIITGRSFYKHSGDDELHFELFDIIHNDEHGTGIFESDLEYEILQYLNTHTLESGAVTLYLNTEWNSQNNYNLDFVDEGADIIYDFKIVSSLDDLIEKLNAIN